MNYTKQPLDYPQIIAQLKSRGLLFRNETHVIQQLQIISYFRIANYLKTFEVVGSNHVYVPHSYFEDAHFNYTILIKNYVIFSLVLFKVLK